MTSIEVHRRSDVTFAQTAKDHHEVTRQTLDEQVQRIKDARALIKQTHRDAAAKGKELHKRDHARWLVDKANYETAKAHAEEHAAKLKAQLEDEGVLSFPPSIHEAKEPELGPEPVLEDHMPPEPVLPPLPESVPEPDHPVPVYAVREAEDMEMVESPHGAARAMPGSIIVTDRDTGLSTIYEKEDFEREFENAKV